MRNGVERTNRGIVFIKDIRDIEYLINIRVC